MSSKNKEYLKNYSDYKRGLHEPTDMFLYIDKVIELFGSDYCNNFDMDVKELIIRFDSFFKHVKSNDAAEILHKSEITRKDSTTSMLVDLYKFDKRFKFLYEDKGKYGDPTYVDDSEYYIWDRPTVKKHLI